MGENGKTETQTGICELCGTNLDAQYEDIHVGDLTDVKRLERIDGFAARKQYRIRWGGAFMGWSDARKAKYAMRLASSYNEGIKLIEEERNKAYEVCARQEKRIEQAAKLMGRQTRIFNEEMAKKDQENQETIKALMKEKKRSKRQAAEILRLREKCGEPLRQPTG